MLDGRVRSPSTAFSKSPKRGPRERKENPRFLAWLRTLPCIVTGTRFNIHAAHIRYSDAARGKINPGIQRKPDDRYCVPLCFDMHNGDPRNSQHSMNERAFWERHRIDPIKAADKLWAIFNDETLSQIERDEAGEKVIREARL
jgi:hypothetical protein